MTERLTVIDEIISLKKEPVRYRVLRFVALIFSVTGWMLIILALVSGYFYYANDSYANTRDDAGLRYNPGLPEPLNTYYFQTANTIDDIKAAAVYILAALTVLFGLMLISYGELLLMLAEIRDDTHATMRLVKRLGLMMSSDESPI